MDSSWSHDVCIHCEQPLDQGAYCSQQCRLANCHTFSCNSSKTTSPSTSNSSTHSSDASPRDSGFQLSPAIDFSSLRTAYPSSTATRGPVYGQPSYFSSPFPGNANSSRFVPSQRVLTPSTSRSSLSSVSSSSSQCSGLSDQARNELRGYSNSFDLIRNWKRRMASN
ncbi:MAG: hypothetical protein L6R38_005461 [Xanthoria sp. 2 TBL-2021]|nr:MAG: hypothetical protein L6R38_005461 [Xanthoria sp. 2 TBL-2021]